MRGGEQPAAILPAVLYHFVLQASQIINLSSQCTDKLSRQSTYLIYLLLTIPRQGIMLSTNEKVPTVPPKTTTMHDYFKPDSKKAADKKRGRRLKKRKSIANESIDLDRGRPSKCHCHSADRAARGLAPKQKDTST